MINKFNTTDIVLAATLKVLGYTLTDIEKTGNKGTFFFDGVREDVIATFDTGRCSVEPVSFNNAIKSLTTAVRRQQ